MASPFDGGLRERPLWFWIGVDDHIPAGEGRSTGLCPNSPEVGSSKVVSSGEICLCKPPSLPPTANDQTLSMIHGSTAQGSRKSLWILVK